jgi:hypothetical protein
MFSAKPCSVGVTGNNILSLAIDILCIIFKDVLVADVTTLTQTGIDKATGIIKQKVNTV